MELFPIMKNIALRPAVPSVQLALEQVNSDDYFQQLLRIDSALEALAMSKNTLTLKLEAADEKSFYESSVVEDSLDELGRLVREFEELQKAARQGFNLRAQSLRKHKLGILDLPNELLLEIFDNLKRPLYDPNYVVFKVHDRDANKTAIQNLRLTCRRFHENSSHLLIRHLSISPSIASLEHLEELTRHPEIWRGERVFKIDLRYYCAAIAENPWTFSKVCREALREKIDEFEELMEYEVYEQKWLEHNGMSREDLQDSYLKARHICSSWEHFADPTVESGTIQGHAALAAMERGHERYRELLRQQQDILRDGYFARTVAAAAAKSGAKVWLSMSDEGPDFDDDDDDDDSPFLAGFVKRSDLDLFADPELLVMSLIQPQSWGFGKRNGTREIPQSLLYEIPLAMRATGACLAGVAVNVDFPLELHLGMSQDQLSGLNEVAEGLVAFTFRMARENCRRPWPSPEEMSGLYAYLRAAIGPQGVPNLWLSFPAMKSVDNDAAGNMVDRRLPIQPLLHSSSWHRLKVVMLEHFNVDIEDLRELMGMVESKIRLCLKRILLSNGTWAAALDCLRSKADRGSRLVDPWGPDCQRLTNAEYYDIFMLTPLPSDESKATQYMTSVEGVENPCLRSDERTEADPVL